MLIAVNMNGNKQTLPISFGMVVTHNVDYCTWFLIRLKEALEVGREVSLITNMDDIISSIIDQVFPDFYHGYCCKSVFIQLEYLFFPTCKSCNMSIFQLIFCRLKHDAHEVLANNSCHTPKPERRKRSGVDDIMSSIITRAL
uniref:MULE transposase domain-containing protein n=1 Tax=Lactuca sativa TaxID=4236 RepID=A0A9R1XG48_LACSA|nr:hypothetical protein LSAT_V11C400212500 [Lactuca sativa]